MSVIKIFGLPRSCTNVTEVLIATNFKCVILNNFPCWKHGVNTIKGTSIHQKDGHGRMIDTDDVKYVICTKNPLDWLWSLYRFEKLLKKYRDKTPREFIESPTYHYGDHRGHKGVWKENITTPIEVYNFLNNHWLSMAPGNTFHVKHESISTPKDQIKMLSRMEKEFGLEKKLEELEGKANRVNPSRKLLDEDYQKPNPAFTKEDIDFINARLDMKVLKRMGYKSIT